MVVADPYRALGLSHDATQSQIKLAYRKLAMKYHPDRLTRENASPEEMKEATDKFAAIAAAYSLLSDRQRKHTYDHIYKFGGYDEPDEQQQPEQSRRQRPYSQRSCGKQSSSGQSDASFSPFPPAASKKERSTGIGYVVKDPFSAIFKGNGKAAVAGIQIPSRMHLVRPPPGGGFRFAFSSGECVNTPNGGKKMVSKTTQFVAGKKYSRVETTTVHPDGRKEVVIEGNDYVERHVSSPPPKRKKSKEDVTQKQPDEKPWYIGAWHQVREKLTMCHNPCGTILAQ